MPVDTLRVLVADDEPLTRWALAQALKPRGTQVTEASSPSGTRDALAHTRFDIAVIACPLGGVDMTDVVELVRDKDGALRLVLLCDDESAPTLRDKFPEAQVIEKPFSLDAVLALV